MGDLDLYVTSYYFIVTTIMTVGYGDITAYSITERLLCIMLMLIGVVAFSFATGAISSIITNQDSVDARLREKLATLQDLQDEYDIDAKLYATIMKALQYGHQQNRSKKSLANFMEELPSKLKQKLAERIHEKLFKNINFFQGKDHTFQSWVSVMLKPLNVQAPEFIYKEDEDITDSKLSIT
jgi:hypothetical protein